MSRVTMLRFLLFLVFGLLSFLNQATVASPLNHVVVFGDSLSDNGNLYAYMKHQIPPSPPYYQGRFSNGPVWVELVASSVFGREWLQHFQDYAFGGAGVLGPHVEMDEEIISLSQEVDSYLLAHQDKADQNTLFVIWIGGNNYLLLPDDINQAVDDVIWGIRANIERLVSHGAQHILVLNLPDLGQMPAARYFEAATELSDSTQKHNVSLQQTITQLQAQYPSVQWLLFDVNKLLQEGMRDPQLFGFSNTTDMCLQLMMNKQRLARYNVLSMAARVHHGVAHACEGYFFFDHIHPTTAAHQMIANHVLAFLNESGVQFSTNP